MSIKSRKSPPFLSIIFSFRNEEEVIPELIRRTRVVMDDCQKAQLINGYEMIFVNDYSSDNSLKVLMDLSQQRKDIKIINMSRTFGVAPCVMAGFSFSKGEAIVYLDADLQDPPELISNMLQKYVNEPTLDVIHTRRLSRKGESLLKLVINKIGYTILNRYSTVPIPMDVGDFKLLSRKVVNHVIQFKENNPFMRGIISWVGFNQAFIDYNRDARFAGKSKFFVLGPKVISNFLTSALINFSSVPLQIASYLGIFAILVDIGILIHALHEKFLGRAVPGWTAIMVVIVFIGGVQLFCLGMIGLYLNSMHEQSKMRPNYIINSTHGF